MGLFSNKQGSKQQPSEEEVVDIAKEIFDQEYREELRQAGRDHFKKLLHDSTTTLKDDVDATMQQVAIDLKEYMTRQLDVNIANINAEITNQMNERISEFNRVSAEAEELVAQSMSRNAQAVYEKYQQLSASLQQTIASQEVTMVTIFQDGKARLTAAQNEQDKLVNELRETTESSRQKTEELTKRIQEAVEEQDSQLNNVYKENLQRVEVTKDSQAKTLETLQASADALQKQHEQLSELLDKSVADQKAMLIELINDNMARIIEHYLIGALGEQSDLKTQLPSILAQLEQNKQAMVEDMKL